MFITKKHHDSDVEFIEYALSLLSGSILELARTVADLREEVDYLVDMLDDSDD